MRSLLDKAYRSVLGRPMSLAARVVARVQRPFMVYGFKDYASGKFRKFTRMSSTVTIMSRSKLSVGDFVWVWHHTILDATEGLSLGEGCQIGAWVGVFTHGSEKAIRLLGRQFVHIHNRDRIGYTRGAVGIGEYSFVGAGSVILPGVTVGKGCLIGTGTLVVRDVPDFSIVAGVPGKLRGSTLHIDREFLACGQCIDTYFDSEIVRQIRHDEDSAET